MLDRESQIEFLLDHYENPRNYGEMPDDDVHLEGGNPGCGDLVTIYLKVRDGKVEKVSFVGEGCTISQAAASLLSERVAGKSLQELQTWDHRLLQDVLGEEVLHTRPRCATLALDVLKAALREYRRRQIQAANA